MIRSLLVANRGEIARRVFAACRAMGITGVAVCSDADVDAPHARDADVVVRLAGSTPGETYLRGDLLIEAARKAGADAIHPGYGFLSENAEFAAAVIDAGLTWVGPPPAAISAMGSKLEAKLLLQDAGVPMLPSWTEPDQVDEFPVLVKASAGGGGRGMRVVRTKGELAEAIAAARREAGSAFGDETVFCERFVETGRHVEVQVFADQHGTTVALGERECSIQRRHQKIVEESPSPAVDSSLRKELCDAAVAAARAVGYVGAGTVEFLLAPDGRFFFLEMNTRLQVEHPVTECVTGLDLVRLQIDVASGHPLPFTETPELAGHAIEVRLYAEDPGNGWRPSTGRLDRFAVAADASFVPLPRPGIRLDAGVGDGSVVSVYYDPMLAKVISYAPRREDAARALAGVLTRAQIHGVTTNRDLLVRVLRSEEFLAGGTDTAFLDRHAEVFAPLLDDPAPAALAAALAGGARRTAQAEWGALPSGWRNVATGTQTAAFETPSGPIEVSYRAGQPGVVSATPDEVVLAIGDVRRRYLIHHVEPNTYVDTPDGSIQLVEIPRFTVPKAEQPAGSLLAPMPATVGRVVAVLGQRVAAGDLLLTLEAMKMEHAVYAPDDGEITQLHVQPGSQVEAGTLLAIVTPDATPEEVETVA